MKLQVEISSPLKTSFIQLENRAIDVEVMAKIGTAFKEYWSLPGKGFYTSTGTMDDINICGGNTTSSAAAQLAVLPTSCCTQKTSSNICARKRDTSGVVGSTPGRVSLT